MDNPGVQSTRVYRSASPQKSDLRLYGPPSGLGASGGALTRDRKVPADLRVDSLSTVTPTPLQFCYQGKCMKAIP
ncbi:hypothetical protein PoB_006820900 [Plakobranchus ocellatus]|uniref:Uncharacterized protein n=1 Tax=Plakobranchus ocellatus TaxID=259542 RepID=A0AAV4DBX5_9GAST|nr:hypothetical protein PoB_006820900 [Plakobranchus ocellatus]